MMEASESTSHSFSQLNLYSTDINDVCYLWCMICMRQGMFTLSGAHSTITHYGYYTSVHLDYYILSIFHYLGSLLTYRTLIFDLMEELIYNKIYV